MMMYFDSLDGRLSELLVPWAEKSTWKELPGAKMAECQGVEC